MKKVLCLFLAFLLIFIVCGCSSYDSGSGTLKADHWYHYKELDIVNVQNCLVSDAYIRVAGNVAVNYYPVCKNCHETGILSSAIVDEENPLLKIFYCGCGNQTTIKIKIVI